jgi:plasmid stabilization system protein ParE
MTYQVDITSRARKDIVTLTKKLMREAPPTRAAEWLRGLQDAIQSLERMPDRCGESPESPGKRGEVIRELLYGTRSHTRRILFTVDEPNALVKVLTVRHSRRQNAKRL